MRPNWQMSESSFASGYPIVIGLLPGKSTDCRGSISSFHELISNGSYVALNGSPPHRIDLL
jgi:hypothetical protein